MWLLVAAFTFLAAFVACIALVLAVRRRPLALAVPLAAAVLVCVESAVVQVLSPPHAVDRWTICGLNLVVAGVAVVIARRREVRIPRIRWPSIESGQSLWIATLGLLAFAAAAAYLPNTGDSMAYHLARVAYWMQFHSVAPYDSNNARQVLFPPGDEYLLLMLQVISRSDRLANFVQFGAWVLLVGAAPALARSFGAARRVAPWGAFVFAATPMALAQASSTQNDLVAATMTVAIVIACLPVLHVRARWRAADLVLLIAAIIAGLLVKPTSVVVATPFVLWAGISLLRQSGGVEKWKRIAFAAMVSLPLLLVAFAVAAPSLFSRRLDADRSGVVKPFLYSGLEEPVDRLKNEVRGLLRNVPLPLDVLDRLAPEETFACDKRGALCLRSNLLLQNEDTAANPVQAIVVLLAYVAAFLRRRRLPRRTRLMLVCLASAWFAFHLIVRDNLMVTRLQLPLFGLAPLALSAFRAESLRRGVPAVAVGLLLVLMGALGAMMVVMNGRRPLNPARMVEGHADETYYRLEPSGARAQHDRALALLAENGCRRLSLLLGENGYDYPLSWRAMQRGVEVRHLVEPDDWPCAVYVEKGIPPPPRPDGRLWVDSPSPYLYFVEGGRSEQMD